MSVIEIAFLIFILALTVEIWLPLLLIILWFVVACICIIFGKEPPT